MKNALLITLLLPLAGTAQNVEYAWLNQPCASLLNCDTGCTACNMPANASTQFFGNDVGWLGVDVCPHPVTVGNNALFTYGWPTIPDNDHAVIVTGIAFTPTRIDSIIIRHTSDPDGPQRMQVRFGINQSMPTTIIGDVDVPEGFGSSVFTNLGDVTHDETMVYGFFSLLLQPYQGAGGSWDLDDLRLVGSPMEMTGIADLQLPDTSINLPRYDALGRPMAQKRGIRFYLDRSKRVVLQ